MKICIINNNFSIGGAEKMAYNLGRNLKETCEVEYISLDKKVPPGYEFSRDELIELDRNPIDHLFQKISREFFKYTEKSHSIRFIKPISIFLINKLLKKKKYDIVILCQGELTAMLPFIKKDVKDTKFITWQHSNYEIYVEKYYKRFLDSYILGLKESDAVVCLTNEDQILFKKVNKNSYCINNFIVNDNEYIENIDRNTQNVVFVSRILRETKGLDLLLEVIEKVNSKVRFNIVGDGPDLKWLENEVVERRLSSKVTLHGKKTGKDLNEIYTKGTVFVSTSKWEGFSLVIVEAMTNGLPIISTKSIGAKEVLSNGKYGFLVDSNSEIFARKIDDLLNDKALLNKYKKLSLEREEDFSIQKILPLWLELFKNIVD